MAKTVSCALIACSLVVVAFLLLSPEASTQTAGTATGVAFDHSGLDENGNPESLQSAEIGLFAVGGSNPIAQTVTVPAITAGTTAADFSSVLAFAANMSFDIRARVTDTTGNTSQWSAPTTVEVQGNAFVLPEPPVVDAPPAAPSNIRAVRITVVGGNVTIVTDS